jgi:hypothetical protein
MPPAAGRRTLSALGAVLEREALPLLLVAFYGVLLAALARYELVGDSWLTLVSGREVAQHGIPQHDHLTVLSHGARWIDQQWLAQLVFYELWRGGGLRLVVLLHFALLVGAFALALAAARRRGASAATVFWIGLACIFLAPWAWQVRAQSFAYPLYVGTLWLLAADSRSPSRRVLAVLPLLALWANLHGSVVLGAALAVLRGATIAWERARHNPSPAWRTRASLLLASPLVVLASPYHLHLLGYYRHMLGSSVLSRFVQEWGPTTLQKAWLFYPLAFAALWLLGRSGGALTAFERLALLASVGAGFVALRHVVWFELTAVVLVPALVAAALGPRPEVRQLPGTRGLAALAPIALAATAVALLVPSDASYERKFPLDALGTVTRLTQAPRSKVLASDTLADWLLWREPSLRGRIAYDVRFEILTVPQLDSLLAYHRRSGTAWQGPTRDYDVLVYDRRVDAPLAASIERDAGTRIAFADRRVVVLARRGSRRTAATRR